MCFLFSVFKTPPALPPPFGCLAAHRPRTQFCTARARSRATVHPAALARMVRPCGAWTGRRPPDLLTGALCRLVVPPLDGAEEMRARGSASSGALRRVVTGLRASTRREGPRGRRCSARVEGPLSRPQAVTMYGHAVSPRGRAVRMRPPRRRAVSRRGLEVAARRMCPPRRRRTWPSRRSSRQAVLWTMFCGLHCVPYH